MSLVRKRPITNLYSEAIESYKKARQIAEEKGNKCEEAHACLQLGSVYESTVQYKEASESCQKPLQIEEEIGNNRKEADAHRGLDPAYGNISEHDQKAQQNVEKQGIKRFSEELSDRDEGTEKREAQQSDSKAKKAWFVENFLDPELYVLRQDVRDTLESFPWFGGSYGITGRNKTVPRAHLFISVKREKSFTKSRVRDDVKMKFGKEALKFVELLREPKEPPSFKLMAGVESPMFGFETDEEPVPLQPAPGGGISVDRPADKSNPLQTPEQAQFLEKEMSFGTLMLFGVSEQRHCGLTCYHVACDNDSVRLSHVFRDNPAEVFNQISLDAANEYSVTRTRSFRYHHRGDQMNQPNNNQDGAFDVDGTVLGTFSRGHFDAECDIVSIKISDDLEVNCPILEANFPYDREYLINELLNDKQIIVEKDGYGSGKTMGFLVQLSASRKDRDTTIFENAFVVKGIDGPFLKPGDSGSLVCYHRGTTKYGFAYGVMDPSGLPSPKDGTRNNTSGASGDDTSDGSEDDTSDWSNDDNNDESSDVDDINDVRRGDNSAHESIMDSSGTDDGSETCSSCKNNEGDNLYVCYDLTTALEKIGLTTPCFGLCSLD